jgi:pimeloyl-ACP methyl ester carboxylesterase
VRARCLAEILAQWDPAELAGWAEPVSVPLRVLAGGADRRIDPGAAERWTETLGGAFTLLPECGHSIPEEAPEEVASALQELVELVRNQNKQEASERG